MRGGGRGARITKTPENPETIVGRRDTEKELMRSIIPARTTRADVKEKSGGGECVRPEPRRNVGVEKQRADTVVKSANDALSTAILLGRVRTSEAKYGAVQREEVADSSVIKLFSIFSLKGENGTAKLSLDIGIKIGESGESVGLATKGECPHIMSKIIQNHQIIYVTRVASNRGRPNITMQQLKRKGGNSGRLAKRKTHVFSETAGLTSMVFSFITSE